MRIREQYEVHNYNLLQNNETEVRLLYDKAVNNDPDSLSALGYLLSTGGNIYKGIYFVIQAAELGSEEALGQIADMDFLAYVKTGYAENWFPLLMEYVQEIIDSSKGRLSSLSVELACQYFVPDLEGYLDHTYYYENKRELSKLNTGRHGCEPYDKNVRDYVKARHYFLKVVDFSLPNNNASEMDIYRATQALGVIYRDGLGVPVDKGTAEFYFMATKEAE